MKEFEDLRMAVDRHIRRMREFARNLENEPDIQPAAEAAGVRGSSHFIRGKASNIVSKRNSSSSDKKSAESSDKKSTQSGNKKSTQNSDKKSQSSSKTSVPITNSKSEQKPPVKCQPSSSSNSNSGGFWKDIESDLEFIDEDENVLIRSEAERELIEAKSRLNSPAREIVEQPLLGIDQDQEAFTRCSSQITTPVRTRNKQLRDIVAVLDK